MENAYPGQINAKRSAALRDHIYADYKVRTVQSGQMFEKAKSVLPGGVSGNLRFFPPYPLYMTSGRGSQVTDIDGNRYIDCFSANGPLLLGHSHPALMKALDNGHDYGLLPLNPPVMIECAELVKEIVPCAERVRFLNTGTEAVMTAVRYARAYTGKQKILKFHGHYHGQQDQFLFGMGADRALFSAGVPDDSITSTLVCPYNDIESVRQSLETDGNIAAVILDPAMHAGGLWGSQRDFLVELRETTQQKGVLLIFDEVITGCRLALGGAQEYFRVVPDLVTMAKALGAGEKLAVVAGSEAVMSVVDPLASKGTPRVFQSGTVNDGSVALSVACAALREYQKLSSAGEYERLEMRAEKLQAGIMSAFDAHGINCQVNGISSMLQLYIAPEPVTFDSSQKLDMSFVQLFYLALINEGVLLSVPTSNHIYLSFAHSDNDVDKILDAVQVVLNRYDFAGSIL
ncbi:aspartate aminotransferase family protein [Pseudomaricurvus alkylphenolicus]|uniref:aspartate aminotransferase family protein n=1 Tax=Pseudomaricurvus alkylphenolicus TaxID=1306991 RepID=UPI0014210CE6|nr:aspartate aminotransferase family protein [Pseudomaricurvus alkylphenolicus]NIB42259.1 aspartate aminotransferase family protein [Pseudomaricurvus alkylphenolicus]